MNNANPPDILVKILKRKREEVDALCAAKSLAAIKEELIQKGNAAKYNTRGFVNSIESKISAGQSAVIAEIKKHHPAKV